MAGVLFKAGLDFPNGRLCRICIFNTLKNNKLFLKLNAENRCAWIFLKTLNFSNLAVKNEYLSLV